MCENLQPNPLPSQARREQDTTHPLKVLLVEDLDDDVYFFKRALKRAGVNATVEVCEDGAQALSYLSRFHESEAPPSSGLPDFIFLDLKMPTVNGFEMLEWLSQHPFTPSLKVIVLTGSEEPRDRERVELLGVTGFLHKPPEGNKLREMLAQLPGTKVLESQTSHCTW
jgi:CheY-like chemotaxis protein